MLKTSMKPNVPTAMFKMSSLGNGLMVANEFCEWSHYDRLIQLHDDGKILWMSFTGKRDRPIVLAYYKGSEITELYVSDFDKPYVNDFKKESKVIEKCFA